MRLVIARLGELGLGLTWGWLLARFSLSSDKPLAKALLLTAATVLAAGNVYVFSDWLGVVIFIGTSSVAVLLRLGWYHELEKRLHSSR